MTPTTTGSVEAAAPAPDALPLVDRRLVRLHIVAAAFFMAVMLLAGLLFSLQFLQRYPFPAVEWLSPGRVRMIHTNTVVYGFFVNGFFAILHWGVPRLTGARALSRRLGVALFAIWQLLVLATVAGIAQGHAQGIEWGETPTALDPFILAAIVGMIVNLAVPVLRRRERVMYVTLWYWSAGFVWVGLTYAMGNFLPEYVLPGAGGAAITGLFIHDLVGLFITPMGWGMTYYFVPVILRRPIWSHALSMVGFWGLAFFYPLNGVHHFLWSPIPMYAQYGAVASTLAVEIVVLTVIINFFMTLRGRMGELRASLAIRYFYAGMLFYAVSCTQCAVQVTLTAQKVIHFSDWVVGHSHLVMFGVFGLWIFGAVEHLWPRLCGRPWWSARLARAQFWLLSVGILAMFAVLVAAGLVQGFLWHSLAPWEESLRRSMPYWLARTLTGLGILAGAICFFVNLFMTARAPRPVPEAR